MKKRYIIIVAVIALVLSLGVLVLAPIIRVINATTVCGEQAVEGTGFSSYSPSKQYVAFAGSIGRRVDISVVNQSSKTAIYTHDYCLDREATVAQPVWGNDSAGFEVAYTTRLGDRWVKCTYHAELMTKHFSLTCDSN